MYLKKPVSAVCYGALVFFMLVGFAVMAAEPPKIALIMDDMGEKYALGMEALQLPGAITYSFLPFAPYAQPLADMAYLQGKELMLHIPMQATDPEQWEAGELTAFMSNFALTSLLRDQLKQIPYISGVNNHKGSLLTQNYRRMQEVMQVLTAEYGNALYFIDSQTTVQSVAQQVAIEFGINSRVRDVFLDHDAPDTTVIRRQFRKLLDLARRQGSALGIAHPRPNTLKVLQDELSKVAAYGVQLVPVSALPFKHTKGRELDKKKATPKVSGVVKSGLVFRGEYDIF